MFRIDNDAVVDATMTGGPARYINHSCSVSDSHYQNSAQGRAQYYKKTDDV